MASAVQSRRPDLRRHASKDGDVTLMFSDVAGYSEMTERLGDAEMHRIMQSHNQVVREQTAMYGGHEVELRGDGFLLAFASAVQAVRCAVALQTTFGDSASPQPEQALRIRIGLHAGEVIHEDDKFFGKTVIQAFRIADLASANEILISADLRERLGDSGDFAFGTPRSATLKGISGSHELFPVLWEDGAR